jgi:putative FmdB family regulatory protein
MPLYDYRCLKCGEVTEVRHRHDEPGPRECPRCGGEVTKLISAPALQFKGSGFYLTDYGRAGEKKETEPTSTPKESQSEPAKESAPNKESAPTSEGASAKEDAPAKEGAPAPAPAKTNEPSKSS